MSATNMSIQVLPRAFYSGRARARSALAILLAGLALSSGILSVSGGINLYTLLGPHVARSEWAFTMTGVRDLNALGLTGKGVIVCLVDSGVDSLHPDFSHLQIIAWRDFVNSKPQAYDDNGHGTAMAGLIAADGALRGAAPQVQLIVAKVIDSAGAGSSQQVTDGIKFCTDPYGNGKPGADIISLSLGSSLFFFDVNVYDAVVSATSKGIFVVVAAGNEGQLNGDVSTPAQAPLAIAVGAVDSQGVRAPFSSIGALLNRTSPNLKPEIVSPGVRLISTFPGAHYITITGTSPAAALTAGILALLLQARPGLRPAGSTSNILTMKTALASGAAKVPGQVLPHDPWYGYGILDGPATLSTL